MDLLCCFCYLRPEITPIFVCIAFITRFALSIYLISKTKNRCINYEKNDLYITVSMLYLCNVYQVLVQPQYCICVAIILMKLLLSIYYGCNDMKVSNEKAQLYIDIMMSASICVFELYLL
jgi:hypothetical protein